MLFLKIFNRNTADIFFPFKKKEERNGVQIAQIYQDIHATDCFSFLKTSSTSENSTAKVRLSRGRKRWVINNRMLNIFMHC